MRTSTVFRRAPLRAVAIRDAMNIAVAVSPILDGKLQKRTPSSIHSSIGWKLGSFLQPSVATSAQAEMATASSIPDGVDAAFSSLQINKTTVSGFVESIDSGVDEQNFPVLQLVLRLTNEKAPLFVRTRVSPEEIAAPTLTRKEARRYKKSVARPHQKQPSAVEAREFVTQFLEKDVLVEGSLRLKPQVDDLTGVGHYVPVVVIPEGELFIAISRR
ncbi:Hypothetical protein, putative [Bodo saltans]|uniref:Uncharacterized protein n=1 Tax=Bodo saltans TaxID=75058 RepID=A0A0S4JVU5_BODSA|nr:Hypothetical protein, putative [Bodo saltans]|eukprot:CUG94355.1 Hypothetical protein, putative [Bodo saltans]